MTDVNQDENKNSKKQKKAAKGVERKEEVFVNQTPPGQKKDFSKPMADAYYPDQVESSWDRYWEQNELYAPDPKSKEDPFVIVIPPPNVTGTLHLGHALTCSIEDAVVRYNRMKGKNTLWVPGTDHAGIATQVVVEKKVMREQKVTRHVLGREKFLEEVWKFKEASESHIKNQLRRLGASVDWTREVFTMDQKCNRAVTEAFIRMYNDKIIYRANRIVTWSCTLKTAISAIEVDYQEITEPTMLQVPGYKEKVEFGVLHSFAYKFADNPKEEIVVATTRLETMLGDVAVVVHPDDERYKKYHGKKLIHPFIADREMVLACDAKLVDMAFGTGAVKLTPGHDPNDFECGQRLNLPTINIFDDDGLINENGGKYKGQKRFDTRQILIAEMEKMGIYRGKSKNPMSIGICSRSKDIVEPVVRPQWWVDCENMAKQAIEKVRSKELQILPVAHEETWFKWLENIRDWCISRQLWWGHRIPAYYATIKGKTDSKDNADNWIVAHTQEEALTIAAEKFKVPKTSITLEQDPDVLDTWFSSGLFPFSVMGWPEKTPDLEKFFPGSLLETGHDILFFWVARMVMMSLHLTGKLPFKTVFLHAMVRDKFGRKMSKSLGNVVDPIDVIDGISLAALHQKLLSGNLDPTEVEKATTGQKKDYPDGISRCGSDALRFGLLAYTAQGRNINLDIQRVVAYSQFCNKLWNATKFALLNFPAGWQRPDEKKIDGLISKSGTFADKWILNRLAVCTQLTNKGFEGYDFNECTTAVYNFWLYDLCDYYLELLKPVFRGTDEGQKAAALATLFTCLEFGLRLLHPMMPFLTEELYHRLPGHAEATAKAKPKTKLATGSIMIQPFPTSAHCDKWISAESEEQMAILKEIVHSARSSRSSLGLQKQKCDIHAVITDAALAKRVKVLCSFIGTLALAENVTVHENESTVESGCARSVVNENLILFLPLSKHADVLKEALKTAKEINLLSKSNETLREKTKGSAYAEKTPEKTQQEHKEKLATQDATIASMNESLSQLIRGMSAEQKDEFWSAQIGEVEKELAKANADRERLATANETAPSKKSAQSLASAEADVVSVQAKLVDLRTKAGRPVVVHLPASQETKGGSSSKAQSFAQLNAQLEHSTYLSGNVSPSRADAVEFEKFRNAPPTSATPHAARWFEHIASFSDWERSHWK